MTHNNAVRAVPVVYTHVRTGASLSVVAKLARMMTELEQEGSTERGEKLHDFLIFADVLDAEPERKDFITWETRTYMVTHPAGGRVFDYHDSYRMSYRIHSIEVPFIGDPILPGLKGYAPITEGDTYGNASGDTYSPP